MNSWEDDILHDKIEPLGAHNVLEITGVKSLAHKNATMSAMAEIQNVLTSAMYSQAIRGSSRKHLSIGYFEEERLVAYVIAFAGSDSRTKEKVICIFDAAVLKEYKDTQVVHRIVVSLLRSASEVIRKYDRETGIEMGLVFNPDVDIRDMEPISSLIREMASDFSIRVVA